MHPADTNVMKIIIQCHFQCFSALTRAVEWVFRSQYPILWCWNDFLLLALLIEGSYLPDANVAWP